MTRFNNLVYLILTLNPSDIGGFFRIGFLLIFSLAGYNLISVFVGTLRIVPYSALFVAGVLLAILWAYIASNSIDIDWELIEDSKKRKEEKKAQEPAQEEIQVEEVVEEVQATNEAIQKVSSEPDAFNFETSLNATFDGGTNEQILDAAVNTTEDKAASMSGRRRGGRNRR